MSFEDYKYELIVKEKAFDCLFSFVACKEFSGVDDFYTLVEV